MAWRLVREDSWEGHRLSEVAKGLVTSLRVAHDNWMTKVFWPTPEQDQPDQERRTLVAGWDRNGGGRNRNGGGGRDGRGGVGGSGGGSGAGGSSRRSSGAGGGSGRDGGAHRRNGGGGGGYGGGGNGRSSGSSGKGSRRKEGHRHFSSGGHCGHTRTSAYGPSSCSSSEDGGQGTVGGGDSGMGADARRSGAAGTGGHLGQSRPGAYEDGSPNSSEEGGQGARGGGDSGRSGHGPLPVTPRGNSYTFLFTDRFSRRADMYAATATEFTAEGAANILITQYIPPWGCPRRILSDNGLQVCSKISWAVYKFIGARKPPAPTAQRAMVEWSV